MIELKIDCKYSFICSFYLSRYVVYLFFIKLRSLYKEILMIFIRKLMLFYL